jgi:DNA helicase IV
VVVAPEDVANIVRAHLRDALPTGTVGQGRTALDSPVVVLTVHEVKGLEFDSVVLVEPATILKASPRGANDLYVALTRPTQRLRVLTSGELPAGLDTLPLT